MRPIARVRNGFPEKFGVPRQPGLTGSISTLEFRSDIRADAFAELAEFSHLWVIFQFHLVNEEETRLRVRPPRLGGNTFRGVFSTRAPFRPNRLGLSLAEIVEVNSETISLRGLDVTDGTPVFDLKPYLPFCEAIPEANGGFADRPPARLQVILPDDIRKTLSPKEAEVIQQALSLDPRPAYHDDPERTYECQIEGHSVRFLVKDNVVSVLKIVQSME